MIDINNLNWNNIKNEISIGDTIKAYNPRPWGKQGKGKTFVGIQAVSIRVGSSMLTLRNSKKLEYWTIGTDDSISRCRVVLVEKVMTL